MRVFVAGATGAIGAPLVSQLIAAGHEVTGTYRSPGKAGRLRAAGAEVDPLDPHPAAGTEETNAAMAHLDQAVTGFGGIALRYGGFYGADNDGLVPAVRKRQFPVVASGAGLMSFIHLDDAAAATVLRWSTMARPSTTSPTTIPLRSATGCRPSPRPWAPSCPGTRPPGWPASSPAKAA
jgi:nucleoside-diphosphate-sugar epimerase